MQISEVKTCQTKETEKMSALRQTHAWCVLGTSQTPDG